MQLTGQQLIGKHIVTAKGEPIQAVNPATGETLVPTYPAGGEAEVNKACGLAESAFDIYRETTLKDRANFLESIASEIESLGDELIKRCMAETGLPRARLEGERGRTCGQMRLFAEVVRSGQWLDVRLDPALPDRIPVPRVDLRQRHIAIGPVAVFGASNFPLAFSVAGGDTAAALAAGCPVVVKAHSAHPGTSEIVGRAVQSAVAKSNMPEGVFSLLFGSGDVVGKALVADSRIKAVGFTGSRTGGTALLAIAQSRPQPIPVYAEMSSLNPVFLLPEALKARYNELAEGFVLSLNMGAGQFCTNPGLIVAEKGVALDAFITAASHEVEKCVSQTMLTPTIHRAYQNSVEALSNSDKVRKASNGQLSKGPCQCQTTLFVVSMADFMSDKALQTEVFGASSMVIECIDFPEVESFAIQLEGQLTATLQMDDGDLEAARNLLPILERKAGRILVNNWPTGVEVCHSMVHGGPYPATSDSRSTSVGSAAIQRFLRPVCYQNLPQELLPQALRDDNPLGVGRLLDGERE